MSKKMFPQIHLEMPKDIRQHVLRYQTELKIKKGVSQYSLQMCILYMLREHEQMKSKEATK